MHLKSIVVMLVALLTIVAACGVPEQDAAEPSRKDETVSPVRVDPALAGTEWFLTALGKKEPLPRPRLTLEIKSDSVGGSSGCNAFGGTIDEMDEGELVWAGGAGYGVGATEMGCGPKNIAQQESAYQDAVANAEAYWLKGDRLGLKNSEGRTTLEFTRKVEWSSDPAELAGTSWVLRSVGGEEPARGAVPTVRFGMQKEISFYDGCQNYEGKYVATKNDLAMPSFGIVDGTCMKPEAHERPDGTCTVGCFVPEGDYRLRDGLLEIRSETGVTAAVLEPLEGGWPKQEGTPWELKSFVEDGESTPVLEGAGITLAFDRGTLRGRGTMFGSTGCNGYRIAYEHPVARNGPDRLILGDPSVTRGICPITAGAVGQEERFLAFLADVSYYPAIFADGRMSLDTEDGRKLIFRAPQ